MKNIALLFAFVASFLTHQVRAEALVVLGAGPASLSSLDGSVGFALEGEFGWTWTDNIDRSSIGLSFGYADGFDGSGSIWGGGDNANATGSFSVFTVAPRVGMAFPITERVGFYIQGQAGVSRMDVKVSGLYDYDNYQSSGSDWEFSWGLGAGIDFALRKGHSLRFGYSLLGMSNFNLGSGLEIAPEYLHGLIIAYSIQF